MNFNGFTEEDFATFSIAGLDERMSAIQTRIQPKFREIGQELVDYLQVHLGNEMFLHIAKHARRTVNPPDDTWLAVADDKRGYKKHPHFQIGLWDDRVFVWLAYIYELPHKQEMAQIFLDHFDELKQAIPETYDISMNHMKKSNQAFNEASLENALDRFHRIKSAELLIGKQFKTDDATIQDGDSFITEIKSIIDHLIPIYRLSLKAKV